MHLFLHVTWVKPVVSRLYYNRNILTLNSDLSFERCKVSVVLWHALISRSVIFLFELFYMLKSSRGEWLSCFSNSPRSLWSPIALLVLVVSPCLGLVIKPLSHGWPSVNKDTLPYLAKWWLWRKHIFVWLRFWKSMTNYGVSNRNIRTGSK